MIWFIGYCVVAYLVYGFVRYVSKDDSEYSCPTPMPWAMFWPCALVMFALYGICTGVYRLYKKATSKLSPDFNVSKLNLGYVLSEMFDKWETKRTERNQKLRVAIEVEESKHKKRLAEIEDEFKAQAEQEVEECLAPTRSRM